MAAAAGKKESVSLSLIMEVNNLEADLWGADVEASWRTCRSGTARDPRPGRQVAAVAHSAFRGASGGGHVGGLPAGREEDASETGQDELLGRNGSQTRV